MPWHRVFILTMIMLTVKDRGSQIQFEPCRSKNPEDDSAVDLQINYEVDGEFYDLVPPPGELWPSMVQEFEALTGLTSFRHRLAAWLHKLAHRIDGQPLPHREGHFRLHIGDETLGVELVAWPTAQGERIDLTMPPTSTSLSHRVQTEMLQLIETSESSKSADRAAPTIDNAHKIPPKPHSSHGFE